MELVVKLDYKDVLTDVTTIDANKPSMGLLRTRKFHHSTFLELQLLLKLDHKVREVIAKSKEFVLFVIETPGRWGFHAREIYCLHDNFMS